MIRRGGIDQGGANHLVTRQYFRVELGNALASMIPTFLDILNSSSFCEGDAATDHQKRFYFQGLPLIFQSTRATGERKKSAPSLRS